MDQLVDTYPETESEALNGISSPHVHSSIIYKFGNMKATSLPINRSRTREAYLAAYYCSALKKERNSYIKCRIDEPS